MRRARLALCLFVVTAPLAGCNSGLAAIFGASNDDEADAPSTIAALSVQGSQQSPAQLRFRVIDADGDAPLVTLYYQIAGGATERMTQLGGAQNPAAYPGSAGGTEYVLSWDFAAEPGLPDDGSFVPSVNVWAELDGVSSIVLGANANQLGLGNDAPVVESANVPSNEASGVVPVGVRLSDTSSDLVDMRVEWQVAGEDAWSLARPGGSSGTPALAVTGLSAPSSGVDITFFWDTDVDLPKLERDVALRFTPIDATIEGDGFVTPPFRVDNNQAPILDLDNGLIVFASDDDLGGIGVPFSVRDAEGDDLRVVFQWRRPNEQFVALPSDPEAVFAIQDDPALRREYRVCSVRQDHVRGRVQPVDADSVRLPETGTSDLSITRPAMVGRSIEFLRHPRRADEVTADWTGSGLNHVAAAVPVGDGLDALVLEEPSSASWRLRRVALATGDSDGEVASGSGVPTALALDPRGETAFVATLVGGDWDLHRVDLADGTVTTAAGVPGALVGPRGVAALSPADAVLTVGDALLRVRFTPSGPVVSTVTAGLAEPWGVAHDPFERGRVVVAERGADRVVSVRLADGTRRDVLPPDPSAAPLDPQLGFPAPRALAFEEGGGRLLVTVDDGGQRELRALNRNSGHDNDGTGYADATAYVLTELPADYGDALATGPDGLRLLAATNTDGLLALGGVEQRRVVRGFAGDSNVAILDEPLSPALEVNQPWRMPRFGVNFGSSAAGSNHTFSWDSRDLRIGGTVYLRAVAFDSEFGIDAETSVERPVRSGLGARRVSLATTEYEAYPDAQPVDYDGDGDLDVMLRDGLEMKVIEQTGPGRFAEAASLGIELRSTNRLEMVYADLDSDGLLDIAHCAVWNATDQSPPPELASDNGILVQRVVEIFYGTGPGTFSSTAELVVVPQRRLHGLAILGHLQAVDYDEDGALDLVMTRPAVYVNELDGTDQEGLLVFRRTAPRTYAHPEAIALDEADEFTAVTASFAFDDLDGDGRRDLVCTQNGPNGVSGFDDDFSRGNGGLSLHFGDGRGGYEPTPLILRRFEVTPFGEEGYDMGSAHRVMLIDLDEDGDLDILTASATPAGGGPGFSFPSLGGAITVHFQLAPRVFSEEPLLIALPEGNALSAFTAGLAVEDMNADGLLDIAVTSSDGIRVHYATAPGVYDEAPFIEEGSEAFNQFLRDFPTLRPCDLDGDGDLDLVCVDVMSAEVFALFQVSKGIESLSSDPLILELEDVTDGATCNDVADMDADGDLDVLVSNHGLAGNFSTNKVTIFEQVSPRSFVSFPRIFPDDGSLFAPGPVEAADLDFDGDNDFVVASIGTNELQVFFQEAPGVFGESLKFTGPDRVYYAQNPYYDSLCSLDVADVDLDGDLDLFSAPNKRNRVFVVRQDAGVFGALPTIDHRLESDEIAGGNPRAVRAADLDGDGALEFLFVAGTQAYNDNMVDPPPRPFPAVHDLVIFEGAGALEPDPEVSLLSPAGDAYLLVEDFDGDGRLDLMVCGDQDHVAPFSLRVTRIFYGNAEGGYDAVEYPIAVKPPSQQVNEQLADTVDWDGDGDLDLVVVDSFSFLFPGTVKVYLQLRPRVFAREPAYVGPAATSIRIRDVDGDGELDITATEFPFPVGGRTKILWGND